MGLRKSGNRDVSQQFIYHLIYRYTIRFRLKRQQDSVPEDFMCELLHVLR